TVQVMWFVGVAGNARDPNLVPWRYTTENAPIQVESAIGCRFGRQPFIIRDNADLPRLEGISPAISAIELRPDEAHIRDTALINGVARIAKDRRIQLELHGSVLSHTYYILARSGATVSCVDPLRSRVSIRSFDKLVRDKIPIIIQRHGERVRTL